MIYRIIYRSSLPVFGLLIQTLLLLVSDLTIANEWSYECSKFKSPNNDTDENLVREWKTADDELWKYVNEKVPEVLEHTGSAAFDEHLKGVQAVLRYWGSPSYLTNAGLFHSIYGTEGFQGFSLPLSERPAVKDLIGVKGEKLAFVFCMVDRSTVDETVFAWKEEDSASSQSIYNFRARPELGRFDIVLTKEEWLDFLELSLADWLEQVEGAATKPSPLFLWRIGEAYAYRRLAYRKMNEILSAERKQRLGNKPRETLEAVMSTEHLETRHLVQARNPPVSDAAALALDALRANGENIPLDLSPQPIGDEMVVGTQEEL
mmetsp:Transcript_26211/g.57401  ORF Transcript_26211/g.57401 Transcript_26211/m.57401 type:complete len:319 (-) Transcript_26211:1819-2775(-)